MNCFSVTKDTITHYGNKNKYISIINRLPHVHTFKFLKETCLFVTHFYTNPALRAADFICLGTHIFRLMLNAFYLFLKTSDYHGQNLFHHTMEKTAKENIQIMTLVQYKTDFSC